jgi:hypothetical protein
VPIVLGGVLTYFKSWLASEEDIRIRTNLKKDVLLEEVNKRLQHLLCELQRADFDLKDLRGAPPAQPDLIADYTAQVDRSSMILRKISKIHARIKTCWATLLLTVAAPLVGVLVAFVWLLARPYVSIVCLLAVAGQIVLVFIIRRLVGRFEECEGMF